MRGEEPIPGLSGLAAACPSVAAEWHPEKNGGLASERVRAGSGRVVWWLGRCGHEWESRVVDRARGGGCPFCAGRRVLLGFNDLSTTRPDLAAEWHPRKNGDLSPAAVSAWSNKKAWWACAQGHEWRARVSDRVRSEGLSCPACNMKAAAVGRARAVRRDGRGLPVHRRCGPRRRAQERAVRVPGVQGAGEEGCGISLGVRLTGAGGFRRPHGRQSQRARKTHLAHAGVPSLGKGSASSFIDPRESRACMDLQRR